jgi:hypothetical protein
VKRSKLAKELSKEKTVRSTMIISGLILNIGGRVEDVGFQTDCLEDATSLFIELTLDKDGLKDIKLVSINNRLLNRIGFF